ncbi:hypothetical protein [Streptomyces sp. NPDC008125]|uniref:hypothetical protein n=1 Tax=Streptomyces sp. NPDC008125 TaxID=3364811 RepID=UPI0036EE5E6C
MAVFGHAELPVPGGGDAPVGPGALAELAAAIDPHLVHHVANMAERDAEFATAPVHTVVTAADGTVWAKTSTDNVWATWWEPDPAWRPVPLLAAFTADTIPPQIRRIGSRVYTRGRIVRADGGLIVGTNGIQIGTLPNDCRPAHAVATATAFFSMGGDPLVGTGRMEAYSNEVSPQGGYFFWSQDGAQDGGTVGTPWIDISGAFWID